MAEKRAIFCVALGDSNPMYECAINSFEQYAKKVGAKLIVQREKTLSQDWDLSNFPSWRQQYMSAMCEKTYAIDLLEHYEQVLLIDCDILIHPKSPDIFTAYSDTSKIYGVSESRYSHKPVGGIEDCELIEAKLGKIDDWPLTGKYKRMINGGVFLFGNQSPITQHFCRDEMHQTFLYTGFLEQSYLNYIISKYHIPLIEMDPRYNWIGWLNKGKGRHQAYFAHHAAKGFAFSRSLKIDTFVNDYLMLYDKKIYYKAIIPSFFRMSWKYLKHTFGRYKKFITTGKIRPDAYQVENKDKHDEQ